MDKKINLVINRKTLGIGGIIDYNFRDTYAFIEQMHGIYQPGAVFLTQTSAVPIGVIAKEMYKVLWPDEKAPKFFTINVKNLRYNDEFQKRGLQSIVDESEFVKLQEEAREKIEKYEISGNVIVVDEQSFSTGPKIGSEYVKFNTLECATEVVRRAGQGLEVYVRGESPQVHYFLGIPTMYIKEEDNGRQITKRAPRKDRLAIKYGFNFTDAKKIVKGVIEYLGGKTQEKEDSEMEKLMERVRKRDFDDVVERFNKAKEVFYSQFSGLKPKIDISTEQLELHVSTLKQAMWIVKRFGKITESSLSSAQSLVDRVECGLIEDERLNFLGTSNPTEDDFEQAYRVVREADNVIKQKD